MNFLTILGMCGAMFLGAVIYEGSNQPTQPQSSPTVIVSAEHKTCVSAVTRQCLSRIMKEQYYNGDINYTNVSTREFIACDRKAEDQCN